MQQVQKARNQMNSRAQWLQLGLLGAGVLAPLMRRWNELRALERTQVLRGDIEERLQGLRASYPWIRHTSSTQAKNADQLTSGTLTEQSSRRRSSTLLWVVGVTVGIIAASITTFVVVKQRMAKYQEEPLVPLPFHRPGGDVRSYSATIPADLPPGSIAKNAEHDSSAFLSSTNTSPQSHETYATVATEEPDVSGVTEVDPAAVVVGNIRTMVYHLAGDENLPVEDNRIYFSSEEEAQLAGYHLHTQP